MYQRVKDFLKLNVLTSKLSHNNFESCLDAPKASVLTECATIAARENPQGSMLEFGVARGGTTCMLSSIILRQGGVQKLYSFDTFDGFDPEEWDRSVGNGSVSSADIGKSFTGIGIRYVQRKLAVLGLAAPVTLVQGYFQKTLPGVVDKIPAAAFCFIDCDLPESITYCAEAIWPRLLPGGYMLFDDYVSPEYGVGVKKAVDAFVSGLGRTQFAGERGGLYVVRK